MPEVMQQLVVADVAEIILRRTYVGLISKLSDEDADRVSKFLETDDFESAYNTLIQIPGAEDEAIAQVEGILEDFGRQVKETL